MARTKARVNGLVRGVSAPVEEESEEYFSDTDTEDEEIIGITADIAGRYDEDIAAASEGLEALKEASPITVPERWVMDLTGDKPVYVLLEAYSTYIVGALRPLSVLEVPESATPSHFELPEKVFT